MVLSGHVDVHRASADGNGAKFVQPRHVSQRSNEHQASLECALVVQLEQHSGGELVGDLEAKLSKRRHLARDPLGELDLLPHGMQDGIVPSLADKILPLFSRGKVIHAVPIRIASALAQHERARRSRQEATGSARALPHLGVLRLEGQLVLREQSGHGYPTFIRFIG